MTDALVQMVDDLRASRPMIAQADEWARWERGIVQAIAALPTPEQQWASVVLVAQDLVQAMPGMPLAMAYGFLCAKVKTAQALGVQG